MNPATTPRATRATARSEGTGTPLSPEVIKRIEESRLRAKAIRDQHEAAQRSSGNAPTLHRTTSGLVSTDDIHVVGDKSRKRPHSSLSGANSVPPTNRDGARPTDEIRPAKSFAKYVDYNISAMTDTKGGFLSTEDDPFNRALSAPEKPGQDAKPKHMTQAEWERMQLIKNLKRRKEGPFEPGLSVLADEKERKVCRECGKFEIDFVWEEVFNCAVCGGCKEKYPEKYSLLTKTECREDYLITDPELKDPELLPHLAKPNPHKSHWHDMMLYLRYQVEEYAFNTKWGSSEALDAEFEKRQIDKKQRKEKKFNAKLLDLKKKTRTEAFRRNAKAGGKTANFGDAVGSAGRHVHEWGRALENDDGTTVKKCLTCGMEVEELEF